MSAMSGRNRKPPANASELSIKPPKIIRKTGAYILREQQLLASQEATDLTDSKCLGRLAGDGVIVCSPPDIAALVKVGSYGKGIFSRSVPNHGQLPPFNFPRRIDKVKESRSERDKSEVTDVHLSTELTGPELDMVQKMSQFVETQGRRIKLHAEWEKEAEQMESERKLLPYDQTCDEEKSCTTKLTMVPLSEKSTVLQTDPNVQLQAVMSDTPTDKVSPSSILSQETTEVMETDCKIESESLKPSVSVLPGLGLEEYYGRFKEKIDLLDNADPYKLCEYLQLGNEEAFYLSHNLKILNVQSDDRTKNLNNDELWDRFSSGYKNFVPRYVAYSYYQERGWVPKSGLKFGVDFVLYKHGPITHHSTYAVIVRMISGETTQDQDSKTCQAGLIGPAINSTDQDFKTSQTGLTWRDVIAFDRVSKSVVKDLIVCYVINHQGLSPEEVKEFPDCLEKLHVSEVFVKRWEPEKERD